MKKNTFSVVFLAVLGMIIFSYGVLGAVTQTVWSSYEQQNFDTPAAYSVNTARGIMDTINQTYISAGGVSNISLVWTVSKATTLTEALICQRNITGSYPGLGVQQDAGCMPGTKTTVWFGAGNSSRSGTSAGAGNITSTWFWYNLSKNRVHIIKEVFGESGSFYVWEGTDSARGYELSTVTTPTDVDADSYAYEGNGNPRTAGLSFIVASNDSPSLTIVPPTIDNSSYNVTSAISEAQAILWRTTTNYVQTQDSTPTIKFSIDKSSNCSLGLYNMNYTTMIANDSNTKCGTTDATSMTCTLPSTSKLTEGRQQVYISCLSYQNSQAPLSLSGGLNIYYTPETSVTQSISVYMYNNTHIGFLRTFTFNNFYSSERNYSIPSLVGWTLSSGSSLVIVQPLNTNNTVYTNLSVRPMADQWLNFSAVSFTSNTTMNNITSNAISVLLAIDPPSALNKGGVTLYSYDVGQGIGYSDGNSYKQNIKRYWFDSLSSGRTTGQTGYYKRSLYNIVAYNFYALGRAGRMVFTRDSVSYFSSLRNNMFAFRSSFDTINNGNYIDTDYQYKRQILESMPFIESIRSVAVYNRVVSDFAVSQNLLGEYSMFYRSGSDQLSAADFVVYSGKFVRAIFDQNTYFDFVGSQSSFLRRTADSIGFSEESQRTGVFQRLVRSLFGYNDDTSRTSAIYRDTSDTFSFSDFGLKSQVFTRNIGFDYISYGDDSSGQKKITRVVWDDIGGVNDVVSRTTYIIRNPSSIFLFGDSFYGRRTYTPWCDINDPGCPPTNLITGLTTSSVVNNYLSGMPMSMVDNQIRSMYVFGDEVHVIPEFYRFIDALKYLGSPAGFIILFPLLTMSLILSGLIFYTSRKKRVEKTNAIPEPEP